MGWKQKSKAELIEALQMLQQQVQTLVEENQQLQQVESELNNRLANVLLDSEQRYRTLAEASFEGIVFSMDAIIIDVNDQLAAMGGYRREELIGQPIMTIVAPESRSIAAEALRTNRLDPYELKGIRKDGSIFPVEARARMAVIGDRQVRISVVQDHPGNFRHE